MTRILCTGDRQIGLGGRIGDQRVIAEQIVDLALDRDVDVILDGGDVFEGPTITPEQLDAFITPLERWGRPYVAISGNGRHDLAMREVNALAPLRHVPGLHVLSTPGVRVLGEHVPLTLNTDAKIAIACLPWVSVANLVAQKQGGDRDDTNHLAEELVLGVARGLREECAEFAPDAPAVLLLHWSISGAGLPNGLPVDAMREPVLPRDALVELGFDAVVASHIHKPQVLYADGMFKPTEHPIFYTGAPQQHDHGDGGQERGVWILDLEPGQTRAEFVPLGGREFLTIDYDFTAEPDVMPGDDAVSDLTNWGAGTFEGQIVRMRYAATRDQARRIDNAGIRQALLDAGAYSVTIQPTIVREQTARVAGLTESLSELDALDVYLAQYPGLEGPIADTMRARTRRYLEAVS